jgi:adenosine/AMP kinase
MFAQQKLSSRFSLIVHGYPVFVVNRTKQLTALRKNVFDVFAAAVHPLPPVAARKGKKEGIVAIEREFDAKAERDKSGADKSQVRICRDISLSFLAQKIILVACAVQLDC